MSTHVCVMTEEAPGLDRCVECGATAPNRATADQGVTLHECACGRGLARFSGTGEPPVCASCFREKYTREGAVA